ncbi:MAG: aminotransferase class V-fold PLP-dependent enzyme [Rhodothermales bacterium]
MDLHELRALFLNTEHEVYLHHAAIAPLSTPVRQAIDAYLEERNHTNVENYFDVMPTMLETRERLARLIGAPVERVEFAQNTSAALNVLTQGLDWRPGDRIAIPACEFPANVYPFMHLADRGVMVDFIPHERGVFTLDDIERTLTPQTRLVSVSWVQFLSGYRVDLKALGQLCADRGILFCVDAIQGLGAFSLDVEACRIDFLACGGHKWLMGPMGQGFLYLTEALQAQLRPAAGWLHGPVDWDNFFDYTLAFHEDATRFRLGTTNNLGIIGLHAALGLREQCGSDWCAERVHTLTDRLRQRIQALGLPVYGPSSQAQAGGIVTFEHDAPEALFEALNHANVKGGLRNRMIRLAPTYYNTADDVEKAIAVVGAFLKSN